MRTYDVIQKWIALRLRKTTLITIAHRLNSVADYDTIIVMSRGRIVENGTPYQLIKNGERFSEMVNNTGKNARIITKIAEETYSKKLNK